MVSPFHLDPRERVAVYAFSAQLDLLYLNPRAERLAADLSEPGADRLGPIPTDVLKLAEEVLASAAGVDGAPPRHLRRRIDREGAVIVLQGFRIPALSSLEGDLIVVLADRVGVTASPQEQDGRAVELTDREREIADLLAHGCTNKEIAVTLGLSDHTVKEYIRHMMLKTGTQTRTQLLAQLVRLATGHRHLAGRGT